MEVGNLEAIGGVAGAILAGGLWLRKLKPQFAADDKIAAIANADMGIIERMEKEGKRLSDQNDKMANSLNQFQLQLLTFQTENNKLSMENNALREENLFLREEITELKGKIQELTATVLDMQRLKPVCMMCEHAK